MGEPDGETLAEIFCFCFSMSSSSRHLVAALSLFNSRRRCSTLLRGRTLGGDSLARRQENELYVKMKQVFGALWWLTDLTTRVWSLTSLSINLCLELKMK